MPLTLSNLSSTELQVRRARHRLLAQNLINHLGFAWGIAWVVAGFCLLVLPFVSPQSSDTFKWSIVVGSTLVGTILAVMKTVRQAPTELDAALAVDLRLGLNERTLTYVSLSPELRKTPIGLALAEDAEDALRGASIKEKFPLKIGKRAWFLPILMLGMVALILFYEPYLTENFLAKNNEEETVESKNPTTRIQKNQANPKPLALKPVVERPTKSETLKRLEAELELEQKYAEAQQTNSPRAESGQIERERIEAITQAEDKLKKYEQDLATKFKQLEEQVAKYNSLEKGESRNDGPAKEFEEAFSNGDLNKAKEEIETLKKKARDKKLNDEEQAQLEKQLEKMQEKLDKINKEQKEKEQQLKDAIEQAKKEGRDPESLEKELKDQQQKGENTKELEKMAETLKKAKKSLANKDQQELAQQLEELESQIGGLQNDLQDLLDTQDHLDNLEQIRKDLTQQAQQSELRREHNATKDRNKGQGGAGYPDDPDMLTRNQKGIGIGDREGSGMNGMGGMGMDGTGMSGMGMGMGDNATGGGIGMGRRPEKKDAKIGDSTEERIRGNFDPKGRKSYAGATTGPAFKKRTTTELGEEIRQAVQDAPEAVEVQRLPKAAREMVKEYFEKLGGQSPPK